MKTSLSRTLLSLAAACCLPVAQAADSRTWTNAKGQAIEAAMGGVSGDEVTLILPGGREATVAIASLSEDDQKWIGEWVKAQEEDGGDGQDETGYDGPPAEKEWPRTVRLEERGEVVTLQEDDEAKEYRYASEHYEFVCDVRFGIAAVKEFSEVFEATWYLNCVLPLDLRPHPEKLRKKFLATIFLEKEDYIASGALEGSGGIYMSDKKSLMVPSTSLGVKMVGSRVSIDYGDRDYRTLIHEITHQMMNHWLPRIPTWYIEGSAEYVDLAEYKNGRFSFGQQENRLEEHLSRYGDEFPMVPVEKLMKITGAEWSAAFGSGGGPGLNYASALVLTYFFYHIDGDGKGTHVFEYLNAVRDIRSSEEAEQAVKTHLLRERSYEQLQEEVNAAMRRIGIKIAG